MAVDSSTPVAAKPRRRRWLRWTLVFLLVVIAGPIAYLQYTRWSHKSDLEQAIAETDALDQRWRLEHLEADRKTYADEDNSATQIIKIGRMLRVRKLPLDQPNYDLIFGNLPPAVELNVQQLALLRNFSAAHPEAIPEARKLKDLPGGRFPVNLRPDFVSTLIPDHHHGRDCALLLLYDAMGRAHFGDPDGALESCLAILNCARSYGDEVFMLSVLSRMSCYEVFTSAVERTLAQGQAKPASLSQLQRSLAGERAALERSWVDVIRGERAGQFAFHDLLRQGQIRLGEHLATQWNMRLSLVERMGKNLLHEAYTRDFPEQLRHMNQQVAAAQLPLEQQLDRFTELDAEMVRRGWANQDTRMPAPLGPPLLRFMCRSHLRTQANLAALEAGLACERWRLQHRNWPDRLHDLVQAGLLGAVPADPWDGQPLRYAKLKDGVAIYSVGLDREDNRGNIDRDNWTKTKVDLGFRLWDVDQRRQPPRPPVATP